MFRRPRQTSVTETVVPSSSPVPDVARALTELLSTPTTKGVLENAMKQAAVVLGGNIRGFAVVRRGQDEVVAVLGYSRSLLGLRLSGPWSAMRSRLLHDGSSELFESNPSEIQKRLEAAGVKDVPLSLVVPVSDRGRKIGALVLDRTTTDGITPPQQEEITRLGVALGPLVGLLESRDEWQNLAHQITGSVVEAVESRDFELLGHAQAVAEACMKLGRTMALPPHEQEVLWFAATMHDLGKLHGEQGYAQVGANFLHGAPMMHEARQAILHQLEQWDGKGIPDQLAGDTIPLFARILAVGHVFVTEGLPGAKAKAGTVLDPSIVAVLEQVTLTEGGSFAR